MMHDILFSNDQQQQEQLIEKYMMLPNQVWDDIINQVIFVISQSFLSRDCYRIRKNCIQGYPQTVRRQCDCIKC